MKEVAFRWIDKYLIHITIQEKFYILFLLPIIAVISISAILVDAAVEQRIEITTNQLNSTAALLSEYKVSQPDASILLAKTGVQIGNAELSTVVPGMNYSITTNGMPSLFNYLSTAQISVTAIILIVILVAVYYIMSFIGGAMFTTNKALQALADGDLTNRLNFFSKSVTNLALSRSQLTVLAKENKNWFRQRSRQPP